jgi:hypothetical protein
MSFVEIEFGHLLPGAVPLPRGIKGHNDSYRGLIEVGNDRHAAYVKLLHPWEVLNEALGSVLCQQVGLLTPRAFVVVANRSDYPSAAIFKKIKEDKILAFATSALPAGTLSRHIAAKESEAVRQLVESWLTWPNVVLFDQWLANVDRNLGNILVGAPGEFYLIDHGWCFHRRNWTAEELTADVSQVTMQLWNELIEQHVPTIKRLQAKPAIYSASAKQHAVDLDAATKLTNVSGLIDAKNLAALTQYLVSRRASAAQIVCSVMGVPDLPLGEPS